MGPMIGLMIKSGFIPEAFQPGQLKQPGHLPWPSQTWHQHWNQ